MSSLENLTEPSEVGVWVIKSNLSRRVAYHAAACHSDDLDGLPAVVNHSLRTFLAMADSDQEIGFFYPNGTGHVLFKPIVWPYFDFVKHDYTADKVIALTPELRTQPTKVVLDPGEVFTAELGISTSAQSHEQICKLSEKYNSLRTCQQIVDSAFLFWENIWYMRRKSIPIGQFDGRTIILEDTSALDYD